MHMCVVLLCLVVCMTLLASFFLPSASLISIYTCIEQQTTRLIMCTHIQ